MTRPIIMFVLADPEAACKKLMPFKASRLVRFSHSRVSLHESWKATRGTPIKVTKLQQTLIFPRSGGGGRGQLELLKLAWPRPRSELFCGGQAKSKLFRRGFSRKVPPKNEKNCRTPPPTRKVPQTLIFSGSNALFRQNRGGVVHVFLFLYNI